MPKGCCRTAAGGSLQRLHVQPVRPVRDVAVGSDEEERSRRLVGQAVGLEDLIGLGLENALVAADEECAMM